MIYFLNDEAPAESIFLRGEEYKYLIKVLRHKAGDVLELRTKKDLGILYKYEIISVDGRSLELALLSSQRSQNKPRQELHIGWCVIDSKSIEKVLPFLSEIGVAKISFIYCERSQKNFKLDFKRYERILEASIQQCGRTSMIEFEVFDKLQDFITKNPDAKVFDFCDNVLKNTQDFRTVLIGCEGGFSPVEKEFLKKQEVFGLNTPLVLRSETAVVSVASKILL